MRSLLLFIGSVLYPAIMIIISPILVCLYLLFGMVLLSRFVQSKWHLLTAPIVLFKQQVLHLSYKKQQLVFRPKAVRLH
ncbi:MAG: hypothetical protein EON98_02480 [Chitinophagaceae bacterium]|nr:MAG: hypothetical protein EON98_02480 [Chitinophagaceae bacterium]